MKSNDAEIMHNVGALATDSIWYTECKIASGAADANVDIVGYSFSESAIANYIVAAEKSPVSTKPLWSLRRGCRWKWSRR